MPQGIAGGVPGRDFPGINFEAMNIEGKFKVRLNSPGSKSHGFDPISISWSTKIEWGDKWNLNGA
jgi:hypothetical protein